MNITDAITQRRTIRKYKPHKIPKDILKNLVNAGRLAPSAMNKQPLEYVIINESPYLEDIFQQLKWAGYIAPLGTPKEGEKPTAYLLILINNELKTSFTYHDIGAAAQNIMLQAEEYDIGCCWIGSLNREKVREILNIPDQYDLDTIIAMGYKDEISEYYDSDEQVKYEKNGGKYRVPKRKLETITHYNAF